MKQYTSAVNVPIQRIRLGLRSKRKKMCVTCQKWNLMMSELTKAGHGDTFFYNSSFSDYLRWCSTLTSNQVTCGVLWNYSFGTRTVASIKFLKNSAITPPFNKVVLGMMLLLLIGIIISCSGMSHNLNKEGPEAIAASSVSFSLFLVLCAGYVAYGAYLETNSIPSVSLS